jgi:hypothetical protein
MSSEIVNHIAVFCAAFCGGWFAQRLTGLAMLGIKKIKDERERKARLEWFKRRDGP